ncbi:MAG TPA: CheR family methyltransferase, partial [Myxococcota bacterium]|nr:CheR family methyltransferase [Myxococcota bacterium]
MGSTTTHFWRHADQLRLLMRHVGARPARVCSLACGTGEEPYTIAIAAHHAFGADALWRISGVDSDGAALSRAREGSFNAWSFRRVPSWFLARYFVEDAQRGASVAPFVRAQ